MADTDVRRISGLERHWHCHFVRGSFGSYRQVAGGQTGRQYGRLIKPILKIKKSTTPVSA
mgnify:CR=1 FL=1